MAVRASVGSLAATPAAAALRVRGGADDAEADGDAASGSGVSPEQVLVAKPLVLDLLETTCRIRIGWLNH